MRTAMILNKPFYYLALMLLFALNTHKSMAEEYRIKHLEPAFWWVNMADNRLQVMVHGDNISELSPVIDNEQVLLQRTNKVDNPNYLFIDFIIREDAAPDDFTIAFHKNGKEVLSYKYQLKARNKTKRADISFSAKDVIYLITPDRFANGNNKNDNQNGYQDKADKSQAGGRHGGDIQGILNHLNYIEDMGYTQIWLNPVIENKQPDYSYHGYSATDFYRLDPRFGNNELYKTLSDQAWQKGIGLIIDVVLNHSGTGHWWHNDLPTNDWYNNQGQVYQQTNHKRESLHDPYAINSNQQNFNDGWFVPTMPDLNQRNPYLANYLIQNTLWWIEYANLSGIRVDTYSYPDKDFLTKWTKRITDEYPSINIVGEEWTTNPAIVSYWQRGKQTHDGYQSYLPSVMDFPLQDALIKGLTEKESWNTGLTEIYNALANDFLYPDPQNLVIFADNHDMSRIYTAVNEDLNAYEMAMTFLLTSRGIPQVFYGTEILLSHPGTTDHGIIRTDFPGGWPNDKVNAFTGIGLTSKQRYAQQYLQKLLNWRKQETTIHNGKLAHYTPKNGVYVYFRYDNFKKFMVVINKNRQEVTLSKKDFQEMLGKAKTLVNIFNKQPTEISENMIMPARKALIFQVN